MASGSPADPARALLALCARPRLDAALSPAIAAAASAIRDWAAVAVAAEFHGLTPLLYEHARDGAVPLPLDVQRALAAQYALHRHETTVRLRELTRVLRAFADDGLPCLVLKGPALVALVYGTAARRPMVDADLLLPAGDLTRAQKRLGALGFKVWIPPDDAWRRYKHHLPPATRVVDNVVINIELHWDAIGPDRGASLGWTEALPGSQPIEILGTPARTLGADEMLWHLCRHLAGLQHPLRLIWIADIVGFTEQFADVIDWRRVARVYPFVPHALALIDVLAPLAPPVRERAGIRPLRAIDGVGDDYTGWPRHRRDGGASSSAAQYVLRTMAPPEWWLRLNYGMSARSSAAAIAAHWAGLWHHARRRRHAARAQS